MRAVLSLAVGASAAQAAAVSPTQKVVEMLNNMVAKGNKALQDEQVGYARFAEECKNKHARLSGEISDNEDEMERLKAEILKQDTDAQTLADEIADLNGEIDADTADKKRQTEERAATNAQFLKDQKDQSESVDALDRAIAIMKRREGNTKQAAASFLQTETGLPPRAKALIADFMALGSEEDDDDFASRKNPEAHAYEFQSGGIVEMLKKLQKEFSKTLYETQKAEANSKHAFHMAEQDLTDSVANNKESVARKSSAMNKAKALSAKASKQLNSETEDFKANSVELADSKTECTQKAESYKEKQGLRQDEIAALGEAIGILSGDSVEGASQKHLSFLQVTSRSKSRSTADVLAFLAQQGRKLHSDKLALLAQKVANDPFVKVKKMIKAMVTKLMNEQNEEATQKSFCDKEVKASKMTRDRLATEMDNLQAEIDKQTSESQMLGDKISKLSAELAELANLVKTTTQTRADEKTNNEAVIADAKAAQGAVARANSVLKEFYANSARATAFIQKGIAIGSDEWNVLANPSATGTGGYGEGSESKTDHGHKEGMQTFGDQYTGQQDSANGVLAMLEVILSDFATLETETTTAENMAQEAFERFQADSKRSNAVKSKEVEMLQADKMEADHNAKQAKRDLSSTDDEMRAAQRGWEALKPQCIDEGVSHEERASKRQEEIDSLKEALQMLQPQD